MKSETVTKGESSNDTIIRIMTRPITVGVLSVLILFMRAPDALYNAHFWAEDGDVFWLDAYTHGIKSLITPYAGYLHTTQRIGAWGISFFPYATQPLCTNRPLLRNANSSLVLQVYSYSKTELHHLPHR